LQLYDRSTTEALSSERILAKVLVKETTVSSAKPSRIPAQTIAFVQAALATAAAEKLNPRDKRFLAHVVANPLLSLQALAPFAGIRTRQGAHRIWKAGLHALWLASPPELRTRYPLAELFGRKRGIFRPHSAQTRAKLRAAQLGRKLSAQTREKMRQAQMGHPISSEARERMKESQRRRRMLEKQRLAA
jgi:NUMOD3 motif